jgi:hypothetical protein
MSIDNPPQPGQPPPPGQKPPPQPTPATERPVKDHADRKIAEAEASMSYALGEKP